MSNLLKEFFSDGVKDQITVMGQECKLNDVIKGYTSPSFYAIITSKDGLTEVEVGGITYNISGHALIPSNTNIIPKIGNRLESEGEVWLIVSSIKSSTEAAYSCDLVRIK